MKETFKLYRILQKNYHIISFYYDKICCRKNNVKVKFCSNNLPFVFLEEKFRNEYYLVIKARLRSSYNYQYSKCFGQANTVHLLLKIFLKMENLTSQNFCYWAENNSKRPS